MGHFDVVPIASPPIQGESLIGYLIRIAGINSYESSAWTLKLAGLGYVSMKASTWKSGLPSVASVLAQPVDAIRFLAPLNSVGRNHSKVIIPNGETISRYFLNWPTKAICSQCARENNYLSSLWDLRLVTHCPKHGCRLREACSKCGERARFSRTTLDFCRCSNVEKWSTQTISDAHIGLLRLLSNSFSGTNFDLGQYGFPKQLQKASFREIIETVALLGSSLHRAGRVDGRGYFSINDKGKSAQVSSAADALADWPHGFFRYIGKLVVSDESYSAPHLFADSLDSLYRRSVNSQAQFPIIYAGFEAYLGLVADGAAPNGRNDISPSPGRHKWLASASDARVWLRVSDKKIGKLISRGLLKTIVVRRGKKVHRLITHESIDAFLDLKRRLIGIGAAAHMLSISLHALKTLVQAGFLTPFHSPVLDGNHSWRFDQKVLEGFLYELEESVKEREADPVQLVVAVRKYNKQGLSYVKLLKMIRDGEIELLMYSQTERGFLKFGVDPEMLRKLFSLEPRRR